MKDSLSVQASKAACEAQTECEAEAVHGDEHGLLPLVPTFVLPASSQSFRCDARLRVTSADGTREVLAKDYTAATKFQASLWKIDRQLSPYRAVSATPEGHDSPGEP